MSVFGQEAVTGVDRVHVANLGGADHLVDLEVTLVGAWPAKAVGLVGQGKVGCIAIRFAEDCDRLDAQFATGADHPQGHLAAISYKDSFVHGRLDL